jgi:lysozyme family protein
MTFDEIIDDVLKSEGGSKVTKDPSDPGGTTKYGISQRAYPDLDIENLSEKDAIEIYYNDYWIPSKAMQVPIQIREIYFDMVVNFGRRGAVRVLQQACNGKNSYDIAVDGGIGPATLGACKNLEPERLRAYRVLKFANIVIKKPSQEKYWFGWFRRALRV